MGPRDTSNRHSWESRMPKEPLNRSSSPTTDHTPSGRPAHRATRRAPHAADSAPWSPGGVAWTPPRVAVPARSPARRPRPSTRCRWGDCRRSSLGRRDTAPAWDGQEVGDSRGGYQTVRRSEAILIRREDTSGWVARLSKRAHPGPGPVSANELAAPSRTEPTPHVRHATPLQPCTSGCPTSGCPT